MVLATSRGGRSQLCHVAVVGIVTVAPTVVMLLLMQQNLLQVEAAEAALVHGLV